jgi:hypothetical protein
VKVERAQSKAAYMRIRRQIRADTGSEEECSAFSMAELTTALRAGGGKLYVHPAFIRQLPESGRRALLDLLNRSWLEGTVPAAWKKAIIVPIQKKNKPANDIKSYRPVSLLPCTSKVLERMVMSLINHWQRTIGLVAPEQTGLSTWPIDDRLHRSYRTTCV